MFNWIQKSLEVEFKNLKILIFYKRKGVTQNTESFFGKVAKFGQMRDT